MAQSRTAQRFHRNHGNEAGFTLVEMLVVLAIIGMITALVGPQVMSYLGRAKVDTARVEVQNLPPPSIFFGSMSGAIRASGRGCMGW